MNGSPAATTPRQMANRSDAHSPIPAFAQTPAVRPSTVPTAAQLRTVQSDRPTSRPPSSMSMHPLPVSRQHSRPPQSPRSTVPSTPVQSDASRAAAAHAQARLFSFTDPRTDALFRAASAGDDELDPLSPRAALRALPPSRAATATPARQHRAAAAAAAFSPSPRHSAAQSPAPRPSPRTEALRFDAAALLHSAQNGTLINGDSDGEELGSVDPPLYAHRPPAPRPGSSTETVAAVASAPVAPASAASSPSPRKARAPLLPASSSSPLSPGLSVGGNGGLAARDSWHTAARASIPLQYDSGGGAPLPRSVSQLQERTRQLMHEDTLRLYKLAHAPERTRRALREKPWREGCALQAEAREYSGVVTRQEQALRGFSAGDGGDLDASAVGAPYAQLSAQLTRLLSQYSLAQAAARDRSRRERVISLFHARLAERRREREGDVVVRREDADRDEALAKLLESHQAALRAATSTATATGGSSVPLPPHPFGDAALSDEDFLARSSDPLARMLPPLLERVEADAVWRQLLEKLVQTPEAAAPAGQQQQQKPLLAPALRFLLGRVHAHYQSILQPLGEVLHLLRGKLTQEAKFASLAASSQRFAQAQAQAGDGGAGTPAGSDALAAIADGGAGGAGGNAVAVLSSQIRSLQKHHLRQLDAQLLAEQRLSEQTSADLQGTKDALSARVGDATTLASTRASRGTGVGAGAGRGDADPDHSSRHHFDWDVRSSRLVALSPAASVAAGGPAVRNRYLEDELEHALADEDEDEGAGVGSGSGAGASLYHGAVRHPHDRRAHDALNLSLGGDGVGVGRGGNEGTPKTGAGAGGADADTPDPEQAQTHRGRIDPTHARYMDGMHAYLASFAHKSGPPNSKPVASGAAGAGTDVAGDGASEEKDATSLIPLPAPSHQHRSAALQTLLTRPLLRMHALRSGDVLQGRVSYHSVYYTFELSAAESGACVRLVQHPSDSDDEEEEEGMDAAGAGGDPGAARSRSSPSSSEDSHSYLDLYLSPGAPPTRRSHTYKATTRGTGAALLDLRATALAGMAEEQQQHQAGPVPTTLLQAQSPAGGFGLALGASGAAKQSSLFAQGQRWYLRLIGRGLRGKKYTLEYRTTPLVLDFSTMLERMLDEIHLQHRWQGVVADKMARVDRMLGESCAPRGAGAGAGVGGRGRGRGAGGTGSSLAILGEENNGGDYAQGALSSPRGNNSSSSSSGGPYAPALVAMYPTASERPPCKEAATQTSVTALHSVDVEASMRLREEEERSAREEAARAAEEARRSALTLGAMKALFRHPLPPRNKLRVWSQATLLKLIHNIYKAKLAADADYAHQLQQYHLASFRSSQAAKVAATTDSESGTMLSAAATPRSSTHHAELVAGTHVAPRKLPLSEFVFAFFHEKYGMGSLAETYLAEFMFSIAGGSGAASGAKYLSLRRVQLFARLLGIYTPVYSAAEVDFFFGRCVGTVWKWSNVHNVAMVDDDHGRCVLPYFVLEDALFDIWSVAQLQQSARVAALNGAKSGAEASSLASAASAAGDDASGAMGEQSARAQEVCMSSWAQMLLGKLLPLLQVRESLPEAASVGFTIPARSRRATRAYMMDSDEFLQVLLDHGSLALAREVSRLKLVWRRFFGAQQLVAERERAERAAVVVAAGAAGASAPSALALVDSAASTSGGVPGAPAARRERPTPSERSGLKLADWLGVMRVEFPWLDDLELFLLFHECTSSSACAGGGTNRPGDAVHLEGFLRVGIRYELLHPPAPAPLPAPTRSRKGKKEAPKDVAAAAPATEDPSDPTAATTDDSLPPPLVPVPLPQLHLTPHRLPFPALVLPGFREVPKEEAAPSKRRKGAPPPARAAPAPPRFANAGRLVWDELAAARQVPPAERTPGGLRAPGAGNDSARRPAPLLDASPALPPALSPPLSLRPPQSLHLVSALSALFQPLVLHHLARVQSEWSVPGAFSAEELRLNRARLADIFEILSDLQMNLDRRRAWKSAATGGAAGAGSGTGAGAGGAGGAGRAGRAAAVAAAVANKNSSRHYLDDPADNLYESDDDDYDGRAGGSGGAGKVGSAAVAQWSRAEWDSVVRSSWSSLRSLLSAVSDLLVLGHSTLYAHLLALHSPDGKAMVATEFAGGDVHRAFAAHAQQRQRPAS